MTGRTKRVLVGCGIGCGGMIVVALVLGFGFGAWIKGKSEPLEPQRLLGADTKGYVEWSFRLEDPGTDGFVALVIEALEAERAGRTSLLPPWLRRLARDRQAKSTADEVRQLFPVVLAWTLAPGPGPSKDASVYSVNPTGLGNRLVFVDWLLGIVFRFTDDAVIDRYGDERIYVIPEQSGSQTFFVRESTVFITSDIDAAKVSVDRLRDDDPARRQATSLDRLFDETTVNSSLRGAVTNDRGELVRLWNAIVGGDDAELIEPVRGLSLEGGLREDGSLVVMLAFHGPSSAWATEHSHRLADAILELLAPTELNVDATVAAEDEVIRIELRAVDLIGTTGGWVEEQERSSGVRIQL